MSEQASKRMLVVMVAFAAIALACFIVLGLGYRSLNHKVTQQLLEQQRIKDTLAVLKQEQLQLIESGKRLNSEAAKRSKNLDEKLKADEKAIDDSPVTDSELADFLSRFD